LKALCDKIMTRKVRDSSGKFPTWNPGDRVFVAPMRMYATVIEQTLSYDYPESFWGNVQLQYDDGITGTSNSWQLVKVVE
jgi:hypothetical protein